MPLTPDLVVVCEEDQVTYFYGSLPVFRHRKEDVKSFRLITSQFYLNGQVAQSAMVRVFGVSAVSVQRAVKLYREQGPGGFWQVPKPRGASVLTREVWPRCRGGGMRAES